MRPPLIDNAQPALDYHHGPRVCYLHLGKYLDVSFSIFSRLDSFSYINRISNCLYGHNRFLYRHKNTTQVECRTKAAPILELRAPETPEKIRISSLTGLQIHGHVNAIAAHRGDHY